VGLGAGVSSSGRAGKKDPSLIGVEWESLRVFDQQSAESEHIFARLARYSPREHTASERLGPQQPVKSLTTLKNTQYAELLAPFEQVNDFSTSSLVKELGENLTSERLARKSTEGMVKAILAKAGIVAFSRVVRVIKEALIVQGSAATLNKDDILEYLAAHSALVLSGTQSFVAKSNLIFDQSRRKCALRDAMLV